MSDFKIDKRKQKGTSIVGSPSLVSSTTSTQAFPYPGLSLQPETVVAQAKTLAASEVLEQQPDNEHFAEQETVQESPQSHDISRISLRPQARFAISQPGDFYEQEADTLASRIMRMAVPEPISNGEEIKEIDETLQRQILQTQLKPDTGFEVNTNLENQLQSSQSGGSPLSEDVRGFMETRFGADFSHVRVHTDFSSTQMNQHLQAQAFTHGNHIYYGAGKFPGKNELTAHELTHTIQQTGSLEKKTLGQQVPHENKLQTKLNQFQPTIQLRENSQPQTESNQNQSSGQQQQTTPQNTPSVSDSSQQQQATQQNNNPPLPSPGQQLTPQNAAITNTTGQETGANVPRTSSSTESAGGQQGNIVSTDTSPDINNQTVTSGQSATSPENDPGFKAVAERTKNTAKQQKEHPPAGAKSTEAQAAATPPANEVETKAQERQVQEMNQQQPGQFNAAAFKAALMQKIQAATPATLEEADNFKNQNKLDTVKGDLSNQVKNEKQQAAGAVEEKTKEQPNTQGITPKPVTPLQATEAGAKPNDIGAGDAAPKPKTESEVSLQQGSQSLDKQMADANLTEEQLANSNEPQFQSAITAKKEAQTHANTAPTAYRQEEKGIVDQAQTQAQATAQTQLQGMHGQRQQVLSQVIGLQGQTKGEDEGKRAEVANHIQTIYKNTKQKVESLLSQLDGQVNQIFDQGATAAQALFENFVDQKMKAYKDDRYSGALGWGRWLKDKAFGMPDEVNKFYEEGKQKYLASMDKTIDKVADLVASKLQEAKSEITKGKQEISKYVAGLDPSLRKVGQEAAQNIQGKFDELEQSVENKQNELIDSLAQKYNENIQALNNRIDQMKAENCGFVDKALDAVVGVIKTILELKNLLLGVLAKAAGAIEKIITDPIGFLGNLVAGIKQGFMNFVGNIWEHLKAGLIGWLTGALGSAGIQIPETFDLKGILSLVMQVLGLTYQAIRPKAAKKLGDKTVNALENSFEWFVILKEQGLAGLWQHIQDKIGDLKTMVLDNIQNFVVESVIKAGVMWVLSLLNPASAFVKACKAIYDIVMFFIERGSQIMELVNAVLDSVSAIASGAIGSAAKLVENALAKALPVVISFLASLLGLGGISQKIQDIVKKVQEPIEKAIDWVIAKAVAFARKLGKKLGFGKDNKDKPDERTDQEKQADLHKAVEEADKLMGQKDATPDSVKAKLPTIQSKYRLTSLEIVKDNESKYHAEAKINPEIKGQEKYDLSKGKGGAFKLAPGGFQAHEGDILSSEEDGKQVHLLAKHGQDVVSAYLKERLEEPLKVFRQKRTEKEQLYRKQIQSIRATIQQLWTETAKAKPDKLEKIIKRIQGEDGLESQVENIQNKLKWLLNISEDDKAAIEQALNVEWRLNITFRATKFYNRKIMEKAIMEALEANQQKIDEGFSDENGNSKDAGTTLRPPIKHKLFENIGVGYELNSKMEAVEIGALRHVVIIVVISDSKNRLYKVETAYPEP